MVLPAPEPPLIPHVIVTGGQDTASRAVVSRIRHMTRTAASRSGINPFYVMEVMRAAELRLAEGKDVLHLEVGQPSTPAAPKVIAEAHRVLDENVLGYTTSGGIEPLRRRIAQHYDEWYGVDVDPEAVMVTLGATGAFVAVFMAAFDHGDRVVVPSPGYPCYSNTLHILGVGGVVIKKTIETRFQPTVEQLEALGPVDGLILSSPSNPTGTMLEAHDMKTLTDWCRANDVWFISDEIYHGITYGQSAPTALKFDPEAIVINSFSKYFCMTGWRVGYAGGPKEIIAAINKVQSQSTTHTSSISQAATVEALNGPQDFMKEWVETFRGRRDYVVKELNNIPGLSCPTPVGAFYVYPSCAGAIGKKTPSGMEINNDTDFVTGLLEDEGVAVVQGVAFGLEPHFRVSYATSTENLENAMGRIRRFCESLV